MQVRAEIHGNVSSLMASVIEIQANLYRGLPTFDRDHQRRNRCVIIRNITIQRIKYTSRFTTFPFSEEPSSAFGVRMCLVRSAQG